MREAITIAAIFAGKPTKVQFIAPAEYRVSISGQEEQSVSMHYLNDANTLVNEAYEQGKYIQLSMQPNGIVAQVDDAELSGKLMSFRSLILGPVLTERQSRLPVEMRNLGL